jgi:hypothetical protein
MNKGFSIALFDYQRVYFGGSPEVVIIGYQNGPNEPATGVIS